MECFIITFLLLLHCTVLSAIFKDVKDIELVPCCSKHIFHLLPFREFIHFFSLSFFFYASQALFSFHKGSVLYQTLVNAFDLVHSCLTFLQNKGHNGEKGQELLTKRLVMSKSAAPVACHFPKFMTCSCLACEVLTQSKSTAVTEDGSRKGQGRTLYNTFYQFPFKCDTFSSIS